MSPEPIGPDGGTVVMAVPPGTDEFEPTVLDETEMTTGMTEGSRAVEPR